MLSSMLPLLVALEVFALLACNVCVAWTHQLTNEWRISQSVSQMTRRTILITKAVQNDDNDIKNKKTIVDVSDLGLTMDDLDQPLPTEVLQGMETSGYESTSRIPNIDDQGCQWIESATTLEATLNIPGLRGQPSGALAVQFSTTTITITAFGYTVWSCILKKEILPENATFTVKDGPDMTPIITISIPKKNPNERWGGLIEQIGEDSIL